MPSQGIGKASDLEEGESGALWEKVATVLRREIDAGSLKPGQQLATEIGLSERFEVSRSTVRRALAELEKAGFIRIEHGRGLFVSEDVIPFRIGERSRFSENMRRLNLPGERQILGIQRLDADDNVCRHLELPMGSEAFLVESVISVNGQPIGIGRAYYPAGRFPNLPAVMVEHGSTTDALKALGVADYKRKSTLIIGRLPDAKEARLLKIARSRPVLELQKVDVDLSGVPVTFGIGCNSADRIQFFIE
jgi:GntR family transcriptional regulator, phosphonate transport system regulatory protein